MTAKWILLDISLTELIFLTRQSHGWPKCRCRQQGIGTLAAKRYRTALRPSSTAPRHRPLQSAGQKDWDEPSCGRGNRCHCAPEKKLEKNDRILDNKCQRLTEYSSRKEANRFTYRNPPHPSLGIQFLRFKDLALIFYVAINNFFLEKN